MLYEQPQLYDALYDRFTEDIPFYLDLCRPGPVCELACGSGRVSVPLAAAGLSVTAVDSQPEMVEAAEERARAAGALAGTVQFRRGDMREPQGQEAFSSVIVPLHSLSHLLTIEDLLQALSAMHHSLKPGGTLALAVHNPDPAYLSQRGEGLERIHRDVAAVAVYEVADYRSDTQLLHLKWYVETAAETKLFAYELRMIFPEELLLLLRSTGFEIEARYGWYDRTPFGPESGTQIVVARRR
ncbi:MAG: class I SAM-dependent methyltransferase [Alkalispirochaeta sp.]